MNYGYKGSDSIEIKVITFHSLSDFILDKGSYDIIGGLKGLVKDGTVNLRDVDKVVDGSMKIDDFENLEAWEG